GDELRAVGIAGVQVHGRTVEWTAAGDQPTGKLYRMTFQRLKDRVTKAALLTDEEVEQFFADIQSPSFHAFTGVHFAAWGQKPKGAMPPQGRWNAGSRLHDHTACETDGRAGPVLFAFESALEQIDVAADVFEIGIEGQGAAEVFEGGEGLVELKVAMSHTDGGAEMIGVQLQRLMAVVGCGFVLL